MCAVVQVTLKINCHMPTRSPLSPPQGVWQAEATSIYTKEQALKGQETFEDS